MKIKLRIDRLTVPGNHSIRSADITDAITEELESMARQGLLPSSLLRAGGLRIPELSLDLEGEESPPEIGRRIAHQLVAGWRGEG